MSGESHATLQIRRDDRKSRDRFRAYRVLLDGQQVAKLRIGESKQLRIAPGRHSLRLAIDWSGSHEIEILLKPDERAAFVCGPAGNALTGWWQVFTRYRYLRLAPDRNATSGEHSR
jgi:hypothetical protein